MTEREHDPASQGTLGATAGAGATAETDRPASGQGAGRAPDTGAGDRTKAETPDPDRAGIGGSSTEATREAVERATAAVGAEDDGDRRDG